MLDSWNDGLAKWPHPLAAGLATGPSGYLGHVSRTPREECNVRYGPVDVVVLAMGEPKFDGSILTELERLAGTGTIRVLDAMVLLKDMDGTAYGLDLEDLPAEDLAALGFIETGTRGLFDSGDADVLSEGMVPGSAIIALAIESAWAVSLMNAFGAAGADLAIHTRMPAVLVDEVLTELAAEKG
jgi:hypothetical protein